MWSQVLREKDKLEKHFPERFKVLGQFNMRWWWPIPEEGDKAIPRIRDNRYEDNNVNAKSISDTMPSHVWWW